MSTVWPSAGAALQLTESIADFITSHRASWPPLPEADGALVHVTPRVSDELAVAGADRDCLVMETIT